VGEGKELGVVMIISDVHPWSGGTQKQALSLAGELRLQGVSLFLLDMQHRLLRTGARKYAGFWPYFEIHEHIKVTHLPTLQRLPAWSFLVTFLIWAYVNRNRFQIIHAHGTAFGVIGSLVGWLLRKKLVVKIPGLAAVQYLQGDALPRRLRRWILMRRVDRFTTVSSEMVQALREIGIQPQKIALLPNGVPFTEASDNDDAAALKRELLGNAGVQVVLYVGRLAEVKGVDLLLTVWASMPHIKEAVLLLVGDGPLREDLEATVRRLGLQASVKFLGPQADVSKFYSMADLFVLPSRSEGMSNALLEAMVAGVPSVASDVGGNRDVIKDAETGFLVNWEETAACADLLRDLLADFHRRQTVGEAAKKRVHEFALPCVAGRYRQLYQALLQEEGPA
jgi:glycosyltransferase involved in cell wall biosynthesis